MVYSMGLLPHLIMSGVNPRFLTTVHYPLGRHGPLEHKIEEIRDCCNILYPKFSIVHYYRIELAWCPLKHNRGGRHFGPPRLFLAGLGRPDGSAPATVELFTVAGDLTCPHTVNGS